MAHGWRLGLIHCYERVRHLFQQNFKAVEKSTITIKLVIGMLVQDLLEQ